MANYKKVLNELKRKATKTAKKGTATGAIKAGVIGAGTGIAVKESKKSGGVKSVKRSKDGIQYTYKDGTGYWLGK